MRKSSIYMLVAAIVLGLFAVFLARTFLGRSQQVAGTAQAVQTVEVVVASDPIAFGEKIAPEKLKLVQWPAAALPAGTFSRVVDAVDQGQRVAIRALEPNELLTLRTVSGDGGRLSTSPLLGDTMRAVAVPINEVAGAGGFIVPGDRVDVFVTRPADDDALPYTDLVVQGARVLAVGQIQDAGNTKVEVTKTATLEVTPLQAQKISLAQIVGTLNVVLRNLTDESKVRLETAQILDLNDGTVTRVLRKPAKQVAAAAPAGGGPVKPTGPTVEVFRGGKDVSKATSYGVPGA